MTPELWQRLKPLYSAALDLPEEGRSGYVDQMCGRDPELAHELLALLAANSSAANTLDPPLHDFSLFAPRRPSILAPETLLADRFRIVRHLGSGGMGDVYEALDLQMEQGRVALKTVRPAIAADPAALARFKDEVRLARKVTGPNVCRIHELYLTRSTGNAPSAAFLTMEMLEGQTLHDRIAQSSPLPLADMRCIAEQLCAALCCIHESGIIHRDLKPRNVMLVPHNGAEKAVVMDFGLALAATGTASLSGTSLAGPALIAGTPNYMAPEQFEGGDATPATDIYALGLILYELATGVQPFAAHTPLASAVRRARRPETASAVRADVPSAWDEVITRCLQYDPALRFQSASDVLTALRHPQTVVWRLGRERRLTVSRKLLAAIGLVIIVSLALALGLVVRNAQQRKLSPDAARWDAQGMNALREGSYLKATRLLTEVTRRDPKYPVAHAGLADAWTELDFTDAAQREMLLASAPGEQNGLTPQQKQYIDAVRNTLTRDYSAAAQDYESILRTLPDDSKAQGYVDLGRIYEKAGKVQDTISSYETAARLNPDAPAPFLHLGILKSRLRDPQGAAKAFDRAEALYNAESDLEGEAEVIYQRGYAANEAGSLAQAEIYLEKSLSIAGQIPSPQLEVRSLSQLSSVAYQADKDDRAIDLANQVIQRARDNSLEYWTADGLVRLATAYMDKEDFAHAEPLLQQTLRQAQANGHPRLEAAAQLTLASMRDQQKRWNDCIGLAQAALKYYQDYGFLGPADKAETLILRGERNKGDYVQALEAGNRLLGIAAKTHSMQSMALAEELVGGVLLRMERFPEALAHFDRALDDTETLHHSTAYQQVHRADALWPLGRYEEAQAALASVPEEMRRRSDLGASIAWIRAGMKQSQGDLHAALSIVQQAWTQFPGLRTQDATLLPIAICAEAQLGDTGKARQDAAEFLRAAQLQPKPTAANAELVEAMIELEADELASAQAHADAAQHLFAQEGMLDSQGLSLAIEAQAAQKAGDSRAAAALGQKSVDIFLRLEQSWGTPSFASYARRADRRQVLRALARLRGETGDIPHELSTEAAAPPVGDGTGSPHPQSGSPLVAQTRSP